MTLASAGSAALILATVSSTYASLAGIAAGALAGCSIALFLASDRLAVRGLSLTYAAIVGGWSFVGCVDPPQPLWSLMLAPAAPLALWCCAGGPLSRLRGATAVAVQTAVILAVVGIAAGLAFLPPAAPK
jgi:hypothetical protein